MVVWDFLPVSLPYLSIAIASFSVGYTVYANRKTSSKVIDDRLRPSIVELRNAVQSVEWDNPNAAPPLANRIQGIGHTHTKMKAQSLDLTLGQRAPSIKKGIEIIVGKLESIHKTIMATGNNPEEDYWKKYGELLSKEGNLKEYTSELNAEVLKWLKKHP